MTGRGYFGIGMLNFPALDDLLAHLPLVGVELASLDRFVHPERAAYLLGAEDHVLARCHHLVEIAGLRTCLNVRAAGSLVMYDRAVQKAGTKTARRGVAG